mgnify:CR=1 FL=1
MGRRAAPAHRRPLRERGLRPLVQGGAGPILEEQKEKLPDFFPEIDSETEKISLKIGERELEFTRNQLDNLNVHDNNNGGLRFTGGHTNPSALNITNSTIQDNSNEEIYISNNVNFSGNQFDFHVNNNTITDDDGNWLILLYSYGSGVPVDFRLNDWGTTVTAEMNSGTNPQDINLFYDWYEDDRYARVNYAGYVGATGTSCLLYTYDAADERSV